MLIRKFVQDYLTFSKKERIAIFCVLTAVLGIYFIPRLFSRPPSTIVLQDNYIIKEALDSIQSKSKHNYPEESSPDYSASIQPREPSFVNAETFQFDPNTLNESGWKRLGLNQKTIKTILNYRTKGGRFYKPEDLMRIWGMPEGFYERVKDFIVISSVSRTDYGNDVARAAYFKAEKKSFTVDINEADTSAFIELPGIGSKLAARIISFREKLGGFHSVDQVAETYGMPDSTFQKLKSKLVISGEVKKISINSATKDELKVHPYLKWNLANAIVEYRNQHGNFKSLDGLKNIALIDEATFNKIIHYLTL